MRIYLWIFCLALSLSAHGAEIHFNFSETPGGSVPTNFVPLLAGGGAPGEWKIVMDAVAPMLAPLTPQAPVVTRHGVLAQTSTDATDERFPMLLFTGEKFRSFKFTTQFKIVSGVAEQMAGVVFRYQNSSNYYVVRASALGKNISFYKIVNGEIVSPFKLELEIPVGVWHTLEVDCSGIFIDCLLDGKKAMPTITDSSPPDGLLGFRTKSDSVVYFNDAMVAYTPIIPAAQTVLNSVIAKESRLLGLRIYTAQTNATTSVIASQDTAEIGKAGTDAELKAVRDGAIFFGREKGAVVVTLPLHDRNGDSIAAVRVRLKTFFGETENNALTRARMVVNLIQDQISSAKDLE
ncbi:MAG TPA: hypothetical protein VGI63_05260 [Verrucomicrobiae bacterium]|jgi:hypothetical protein